MTIEEALKVCTPSQYIARREWIEKGCSMRLISSAKTMEEFNITLTSESKEADDWDIYEEF